MKVVDAVAKVLKAEGVEYLFAYPVNPIIEAAAKLDIRPIIVRQERIGLHMADAMSRMTSGEKIGVFCMQSGPRFRKRVWWCCASVWRFRTDCSLARWLFPKFNTDPTEFQFCAELSTRNKVV